MSPKKQILTATLCLLTVGLFALLGGCGAPQAAVSSTAAPVSSLPTPEPAPAPEPALVAVFAGSLLPGYDGGQAAQAQFIKPYGLCAYEGGVLVVDSYSNLLRKVTDNMVSNVAGEVSVIDRNGYPMGGYLNGTAEHSMLNRPRFAAASNDGSVVFSDSENHLVRVVDGGKTYLLAGTQTPGYRDGDYREAQFNLPSGIAIGGDGTVLVADTLNHAIRMITADGQVSTLAGNPAEPGFRDGAIEQALFCEPNDIALGADGALYVVDKGNQRIRKILAGEVTTVAGSGTDTDSTTGYVVGGYDDGAAQNARFRYPTGLCLSDSGTIYVADTGNNCVRAISPQGEVVTVAGMKTAGNIGGMPRNARFNQPLDVLMLAGTLYISDSYNHVVRAVEMNETDLFNG